jgi:hypothetical protein
MGGAAQPVTSVPVGTGVRVKLLQFISSETSQPTEVVRFEVARDVVNQGVVLISRRTPVVGSITRARAHRVSVPFWSLRLSSPGQLMFAIAETKSVNGDVVRLNGPIMGANQPHIHPLMTWHHKGEEFDAVVVPER